MCFAQLTWRESLRDIELCLRSMQNKLGSLGLHSKVSRNTLAKANEKRDSRIYRDFCRILIKQAKELYSDEKFSKELDETVYVLDSTYISLCLSMFPWGQIGAHNRAIFKIHTLLDLRGSIPSFIDISRGNYPDNKMLDKINIEPGAFYIMDKAYVDFQRLYNINQSKGYFVVRFKKHINFQRNTSADTNIKDGILLDQAGILARRETNKKYPDQVRKIVFYDKEKNKKIIFLTNNFSLKPQLIAMLYKQRWQIEIFFKWIKQNLRIKKFYGTSRNAVETQIWIAISTYLLIAIAKKQLRIKTPLYQILHFTSVSLFENIPLLQALNPPKELIHKPNKHKQLNLFNC
jgi:IS4 transposase